MTPDRPLLGILLMIAFCAVAPIGDATAKLLGESIPLLQLLIVRFAAQAVLLLPIIWASGRSMALTGWVMRLTFLRTIFHILGIGAMFLALQFLPLADAVAIAFVMPFIMLLLGRVILGEEVGPRRLAACAVGFAGTLLVVQPSFVDVGPPALLPLVVALVFAIYMLISRRIAKAGDPLSLQAVGGLMATPLLLLLAVAGRGSDIAMLGFKSPDLRETLLLALVASIGTLAHLLMTWSLRFAPSATLAPIQYLEIPFACLVGWIVFADFPDGIAALGILITMGAGFYVVLREQATAEPVPSET